uniref:Tryptophan synthase beta chain-like PALP domain-containing protein n=1 Tax=Leersia perrieri TaxID=77586 RepID=A0A0D9WLY8_9ORYZ
MEAEGVGRRGLPSLLGSSCSEGGIGQEHIASDVTQLIGWTPLVELKRIANKDGVDARIVGKVEAYQPLCSVKDRSALRMIEDAEEKGLISPGVTTLVEPTSGNLGLGLMLVALSKGYKFIAVMPGQYSLDKQILLRYMGVEVFLTDPTLGFQGLVDKVEQLKKELPNVHILDQISNPANQDAHMRWTGPEIWKDTAGKVDIFVTGSGSGGTVSGVGKYLKMQNPSVKIICVEPEESPVISGGEPGKHKIQGIGPGFKPAVLDTSVIDEVVTVNTEEAMVNARRLAMEEGLLMGISSGANLAACLKVASKEENKGKMIVTMFPSGGERYMNSDLFAALIGWTPLVELKRIANKDGVDARIVGKVEAYQPLCSVKDRSALRMIEDAEEKGLISPGVTTLVEPTSGNLGLGLILVALSKGYKFIAVMPGQYSLDKQILLRYMGVEVFLTDPILGFQGLVDKVEQLKKELPYVHVLDQFSNPANQDAHMRWTGPEIWKDTAGKVDIFVTGSGSGGTVSGVGKYLKMQNPAVKIICVEPAESPVISGGEPGKHKIQGIGPGFKPAVLDTSVIDEVVTVNTEEAMVNARRLAMEEGLLMGISSGANLAACLKVASKEENKGKMIVTMFPSGGERYMNSDLFAAVREECIAMTY